MNEEKVCKNLIDVITSKIVKKIIHKIKINYYHYYFINLF